MSRKTGFTIIELLTVIAIIGILIAIIQPMLMTSASKTYEYQCESRLRQIGVAMNAYAQDYGVFPGELDAVDALLQDKSVLSCPKTSREYWYRNPGPDADRDTVIAACVGPSTRPGRLPHHAGKGYLSLSAGGEVKRVRR